MWYIFLRIKGQRKEQCLIEPTHYQWWYLGHRWEQFLLRCPPDQTMEAAHEAASVYFCFDKKIYGARALLPRARPCETALYWNLLLLLGRAVENCSCLTQLALIQGPNIHCPVMWAGLWCALKMPPAISVNKGCLGHQLLTLPPHTHTLHSGGIQDEGKQYPDPR